MLYFGSFNPIHKGHIALAEYVMAQGLCDEVALIISPQSPYKQTMAMASENDRFEMAEMACQASKYPETIRPSVVEFLLPKPSYTINTLTFLEKQCGEQMRFSILMGQDQLERLNGWKDADKILNYPIWVYPRKGETFPDEYKEKVHFLHNAPLFDFSSTEIRRRIEMGEDVHEMLNKDVEKHIRQKGLWSVASKIALVNSSLENNPQDIDLLLERGRLNYRQQQWEASMNDFQRVLQIAPEHVEAKQYIEMMQEILGFRTKNIQHS